MPSHVHMLISVPPKYSVAELIGFMKGQSHHKSSRVLPSRFLAFPIIPPA